MNKTTLAAIAQSFVFRKLSPELVAQILGIVQVLETVNEYTMSRYGEIFWTGGFTKESFNSNFRLVCPATSLDIDFKMWPPFYKSIFVERVPFIEGQDYAKFGVHKNLKKPLLVK